MTRSTITFRIRRFRPNQTDPPRIQDFGVPFKPQMTVLEALETIRLTQDPTLMYRRSCHHGSCGTCACMINGAPALACTTQISQLEPDGVALAPLDNLPCLGDLVVDTSGFFNALSPDWSNVRICETDSPVRRPDGVGRLMRLENCIECGCCTAVCPVVSSGSGFMGPAALAALHNEMRNNPDTSNALLDWAAGKQGADRCRRHIHCSRVCPSKVYPARRIAELQRAIAASRQTR